MQNPFTKFWPWFFFAAAFQSLLALAVLLLVPSERLSLARIGLLGILTLFLFGGILLGLVARRDPSQFDRFARTPYILSSALLILTSGMILFLLRYLNPEDSLCRTTSG
jgi:hypothetical protein